MQPQAIFGRAVASRRARAGARALAFASALLVSTGLTACESSPPKMRVTPVTRVGDDIVVRFDRPIENRPAKQYWIALQRADTPPSSTEGRVVLERGDQFVTLHAVSPGESEVRLHDGYPGKDHHLVARVPIVVLHRAGVGTGPAVD